MKTIVFVLFFLGGERGNIGNTVKLKIHTRHQLKIKVQYM